MVRLLLKSISTYGFKSFADKIELEFNEGITAIVGPNGSGKSNVSDAVRWVLGEQSAKYLRGSKMEDVIFSGTSKRRPLGVAEVNLVFDNSDRTLPIDFEEVSITRRVFRSGDSEYAINKKNCRLKDILDLIADTGLGRGSMSIIGQNKIDEILNSRPEDRRAIFEEAAGIAKYRMRKKEATRRLEDTANNLTRINDIKTEVEGQVEPLRIEAEKTAKFNMFNSELRNCKLTQFVRKIETIEEQNQKLLAAQEVANNKFLEKSTAVSTQEAECTTYQMELDKLSDEYNLLQEGIKEKETAIEKVKGQDAVLEERMRQSEKNALRLKDRNDKLTEQINELDKQLKILVEEFDKLEEVRHGSALLVERLTEEQEAKEKLVKDNETLLETMHGNVFESMQDMVNMRNQVRAMEQEQELRMRKREALKKTLEEIEEVLNGLNANRKGLVDEQARIEQVLDQYAKESAELQETIAKEQGELDKVLVKYNECQNKITALESRLTILKNMQESYDGFGYGIKSVMNSKEAWRKDVLGVVAELIKVPNEYVVAIETALGATAQNVIMRSAESSKKAIADLKSKNGGRATFLPLDTLKVLDRRSEDEALAKNKGIKGFASDLISCDKEISPAVKFLLSRVLIAEDLDSALAASRKSGFRLRAVTLQGDVVNAGGSMTGGSRQQKEAGYLSRNKAIEEQTAELKKLNKELLAQQEEREVFEDTLENYNKRFEEINSDVQDKKVRLAEVSANVERAKAEVEQENKRLELTLNDRNEIAEEYMAARKDLAELMPKLEELEAKDVDTKERLDKLQKQIGSDNSALITLRNKLQDARVQNESATARSSMTEERISQIDTDMGRLQDEFTNNENEQENLANIVETSREEKDGLEDKSKALMEELKEVLSGKDEFGEKRIAIAEKQAVANEKLAVLRKEQTLAENKVRQGEMDVVKLDSDYEHALEQLNNEYKLTLEEAKEEELLREENDLALRKLELKLDRQISELGPINAAAIEQYAAVSERYEFLEKQYSDLCEAKSNLEAVISEINTGMAKRFKEAFNKINEHFSETYVQLFGGGTAVLRLSNPDDVLESGIDIEVQPPGKRLQSLFLLSGGERALTVIALLFALLSYQPAPFCILDEIDAPLDDANIGRFAKFLASYAANSQFIVITHRKGTMESANIMYGITMEESGVSKVLSVKMSDAEK